MATGFLQVTVVADETIRIEGAQVVVEHEKIPSVTYTTNKDGKTPLISLETVDKEESLKPESTILPFFIYRLIIRKPGYQDETRDNITIFDGETSTLLVSMVPVGQKSRVVSRVYSNENRVNEHSLPATPDTEMDMVPVITKLATPVLPIPIIPYTIAVKLGAPSSDAKVVLVDYKYYIKNVASSEIFPTWPEQALRANIYAIQSIALNRVYTEWYRQRGFDFSITSSTAYDQKFIPDRVIYENIANIVDEIFMEYAKREGFVEPLFTTFCDGKEVTCQGLHQWGTVDLANQGKSALDILKIYYGQNTILMSSPIIQELAEGFPGTLRIGDIGQAVLLMQIYLLRISVNYPAIPQLFPLNSIYDQSMAEAVRIFQRIFNLTQTGEIDRSTWYKITFIYHSVKRSAEVASEGIITTEHYLDYSRDIKLGDRGAHVLVVQMMLNSIGELVPSIKRVVMDRQYGPSTKRMIEEFQRHVGLPVTGIVDRETWNTLRRYYMEIIQKLPTSFELMPNPGKTLRTGDEGLAIQTLQQYLNMISEYYAKIPKINASGMFTSEMADQVRAFQTIFNLPVTGIIDEATWQRIINIYSAVLPVVLYPGMELKQGDTSYYVGVIQDYLNSIAQTLSSIPKIAVTQFFDEKTEEAVDAFQRQVSLPDTGIIDKETWNAILRVYTELAFALPNKQ